MLTLFFRNRLVQVGAAITLVGLVTWITFSTQRSSHRPASEMKNMRVELQPLPWEAEFFPVIDRRSDLAGLERLKGIKSLKNSMEVRLWIGFGVIPLEGIVMKRIDGTWSATHLLPVDPLDPRPKRGRYEEPLPSPKAGWDEFWKLVDEQGISSLPDSTYLLNEVPVFDGDHFVVEINNGGIYRNYHYSNPRMQAWPEAKKMLQIVKTTFEEFDIKRRI